MKTKALSNLVRLFACSCLVLGTLPAAAAPQEGMLAPALRAELLNGETFDSEQQRGNVIVLNFWASWCKPCREEMPALDAFYRAHRAEGLAMLAISIEGPEDLARVRRATKDFSFPVAMASGAQVEAYGRQSRIPVTFVIDKSGVLRFDGYKFAKMLDLHTLERIVLPLLRRPRGSTVAVAGRAEIRE